MRRFVLLRVPVTRGDNREAIRRPSYLSPGSVIVGEFDDADVAARAVEERGYEDKFHHYYALELRFYGAPDERSAIEARHKTRRRTAEVINLKIERGKK